MNLLRKLFGTQASTNLITEQNVSLVRVETICPHCKKLLQKAPKTKSECQFCKQDIYVRKHYETKQPVYLTAKEKEVFDSEKEQYYFSKEWLRKIKELGISDDQIDSIRNELLQKWGEGHPSFNDLIWKIFNNQVIELSKKNASHNEFKMLYFIWALFACEINSDPTNLLQQSHKWKLLGYKDGGIHHVEILSNQGCDICNSLNGKVFSIEEAIKRNLLPNKNCIHKLAETNKYSWCRCMYSAHIEGLSDLTERYQSK